jgi:hypothetical protein
MAREELTVTQITREGAFHAVATGVADGHKFLNNGRCFAIVQNADEDNPHTITVISQKTVLGLPVGDKAVVIPKASTGHLIGPWPSDVFNAVSGTDEGMCYFDYEAGEHAHFSVTVYEL